MNTTLLQRRGRQLLNLYRDREYFSQLFKIAMPIALQNLVVSLLNMVGVMMIGQLGETPIAAVGLANQIFFLFFLLMFGITSGSAIFTAQFWGKGDIPNIRKVLSLSVFLGILASLVFLAIAELAPRAALRVYSADPEVIAIGSEYLRIYGWAFLFMAITLSFSAVLRSTGDVKIPMVVSISALGLNMILSYSLILGHFGLPAMGVQGAGLSVLIARIFECGALLWLTYRRKSPAAVTWREMFSLDIHFAGKILRPVLPVALNELFWSLGITAYNIIFAHIGTGAIAAMNIVSTIDSLALVIFMAISNACAILVGNRIGANEEGQAFRYAVRSLGLNIVGAWIVGGLLLGGANLILGLYKVSPAVIEDAQKILVFVALFLWVRVSNMVLIVGVLRGGGDTRFSLIIDVGSIWVVGIPLALLGAFVLHLSIEWVYLMIMGDEVSKWIFGVWRLLSRKWIHNLAQTV